MTIKRNSNRRPTRAGQNADFGLASGNGKGDRPRTNQSSPEYQANHDEIAWAGTPQMRHGWVDWLPSHGYVKTGEGRYRKTFK